MASKFLEAVYTYAMDDVVLERAFPPDKSRVAASYFGGLPRLPAELDWPFSDHLGQHLNFLAQIDLDNLPAFQWRSRLPESGTLFFFINSDGTETEDPRPGLVLFSSRSCLDVPERPAPATLMKVGGTVNAYAIDWLTHDDDKESPLAPRLFPYWPISPRIVRTFSNTDHKHLLDDALAGEFREAVHAEQGRALVEEFGSPGWSGCSNLAGYWANADGSKSPLGALPPPDYPFTPQVYHHAWLPDPDWPYAWIFAEIFCVQLLKEIDRHLVAPESIEAKAREWRGRAAAAGLFVPMPNAEREAFRAWIKSLPFARTADDKRGRTFNSMYQHNWARKSLISGIDACLGYAKNYEVLFPQRLLAFIRDRHSVFAGDASSYRFRPHQLLGAPHNIQETSEEYSATHMLLAQFPRDAGMLWCWSDLLQFWIKPQDLAAGRFDLAVALLEHD